MYRHLICLGILLSLLIGTPYAKGDISDGLIGYWNFDDGTISGATVYDNSIRGNDGISVGSPTPIPGKVGTGALAFGPSKYIIVDGVADDIQGDDDITLNGWIKTTTTENTDWLSCNTASKGNRLLLGVAGNTDEGRFIINDGGTGQREILSVNPVNDNQWHMLTYAKSGSVGTLYVDSAEQGTHTVSYAPFSSSDLWSIAMEWDAGGAGNYFSDAGQMDEVAIWRRSLTTEEIVTIYNSGNGKSLPLSALASILSPADGAIYEATWANLKWRPGGYAVSHDVYIGDSFDDVNDGAEGTFLGNQTTTTLVLGFPGFPIPSGLVPGTTYYWRVDEVNDVNPDSPWKGDVWSFTVPSMTAYEPIPADGAQFTDPSTELGWTPGFAAKMHTVYFGDSFEDVSNATGGTAQGATVYTPGPLESDKIYYWRVDEFDAVNTYKGDVWSFRTLPVVPISDPNLIGWWTFDEGMGTIAMDWSGHGNDGTLVNGPKWLEGYMDGALEFNGSNYVVIDAVSDDMTSNDITLSGWVKTTQQDNNWFSCNTASGGNVIFWAIKSGGRAAIRPAPHQSLSTTIVSNGEWHMLTFVRSGSTGYIYVDGVQENAETVDFSFSVDDRWSIGQEWDSGTASNFLIGDVDDVRIYNKSLTPEEIQLVMRGDPLLAWAPSPSDGSTPDIDNATPLSWSPGDMVSQHDVYFGMDKDALDNADNSDTTGVYRGSQNGMTFTPAEGVEWGAGPFYWRIDENNADGVVTKGRVWTFTVADFILLDDFESYTDNDADNEAVWQSWLDGFGVPANGSQVGYVMPPYAEQTIVNGGSQSMPLSYDNTAGVTNSQAELTLTSPRDWTTHGVGVLSLWFRGYPASVGSFTEGPVGTFTMTAGGADIAGTADEFHFAYKTLTGQGSITARIDSVLNTHDQAKAGVMIRATLDQDSAHAFACVTPGNGVGSLGRTAAAASSFSTYQAGVAAPHWVKLERDVTGNFTVSHSTNGSAWQPVELSVPTAIPMDGTVHIGLALTSHNTAETGEAKFSNVTMTGNVGQQWTSQDVGILGNDAEPLYVAVTDAAGTSAVVSHDDAGAATIDVWTEWIIDLKALADQGVNMANVDKIAVGLGTQANMTAPGGSGTVFFDDMRLLRPSETPQP